MEHGMKLSHEQIGAYLENMGGKNYSNDTVVSYQRLLEKFYLFLPESKYVHTGTLEAWQNSLLESGYSAKTVNVGTAAANGLMVYCGHREFQADRLPEEDRAQPELTRSEYLRLLSAARQQGNEKKYLLVKVFGVIGLGVSELKYLTVEAVKEGEVSLSGLTLRIPSGFRRELLRYIREKGITTGPVFVTKRGKPMDRVSVTKMIQTLCQDARVEEEKANPRCLKKLCQATKSTIQRNFELLIEQAYDQMLEKEQKVIGWQEYSA